MTHYPGLEDLRNGSLFRTVWGRRTHRVSRGSSVRAGSMSYESEHPRTPPPPSELEEAILIAATGTTGLTMPDRPFTDPETGNPIMAKPNLVMAGRTAGSPDNAQGTHFFMINDSGTYFLRSLPPPEPGEDAWAPDQLLARAKQSKVCLLDHRVDVAPACGTFQPTWIPTASSRTCPARRSSSRSSIYRVSTSTPSCTCSRSPTTRGRPSSTTATSTGWRG